MSAVPICATPTKIPSALAGKLYDSLYEKILTLPDEVKVYPVAWRRLALRARDFGRALLPRRSGTEVELGDANPGSRRSSSGK